MKVTNLRKQMNEEIIITQINFELFENEIVGLIGRNGSGKTTLFRTIAGNYLPETGDIQVAGASIYQDPTKKAEIFYIDELDNFLSGYTLKNSITFTVTPIQSSIKTCTCSCWLKTSFLSI